MASSLYEHLLTQGLAALARARPAEQVEKEPLDEADSSRWLSRHAAAELQRALKSIKGSVERRVELTNRVLQFIRESAPGAAADPIEPPGELLFSLHDHEPLPRTANPFAVSALLTRAQGEPAIGHELAREIASAHSIDALVSFVTVSGVRALQPALEEYARRGGPLRLLTTTYIGATDADAVEAIARLPNAQVRISYDARRTRLHAKAWLFSRPNELDTAYVGSANLSQAALFSGHEWMIKASRADLPHVLDKFRGAFETLWELDEFEAFDPESASDRARLREALQMERGGQRPGASTRAFFTLKPFPFQQEILERLEAERELHGRTRNLVVAATGTGKTVVAAFDYARQTPARPRLLFLAHREELLVQARDTFRHVLRDESFGELLTGGHKPVKLDHLFATIQSFGEQYPAEWDYVVIDECHHLPAPSYQAVMARLRPRLLLGLTATPERSDGRSLLPDFQDHVAAELRLWHALGQQLLSPFEYYGLHDGVDLQAARWTRGAYASEDLDRLYTGNDRRVALVLEQLRKRVGDDNLPKLRALGFCVSIEHAEFMARKFREAGIPAQAVHGRTPEAQRAGAPALLESRAVNVLFTCDLYNEGVDLPFVDTLLFLRPTASATLFLQQLGRGLRLHEGKLGCLVLDFIGQHREEFRFDRLLSAMTGLPRGKLREAVEQEFPTLPSGCHLALDAESSRIVLANVKRALRGGARQLADEVRTLSAGRRLSLADYLHESGRELHEVYKAGGFTTLSRAAGLITGPQPPGEAELNKKLGSLLHVDDPARLALYQRAFAGAELPPAVHDAGLAVLEDPRRLLMLGYQLFHEAADVFDAHTLLARFQVNPYLRRELAELSGLLLDRVPLAGVAVAGVWPLSLHRHYSRREVQTAVGHWNEREKPRFSEGVLRLPDAKTELLFVTLDKSHERFSPTTRYEDYAISDRLFHWQSQSNTSETSESGQRYQHDDWQFLLFVRPTTDDAYAFLGPVRYVKHQGSRPMSITWRLDNPIPGSLLRDYASLASG